MKINSRNVEKYLYIYQNLKPETVKHTEGKLEIKSAHMARYITNDNGTIDIEVDGMTVSNANAERIVLTWNAHDDLVAALQGLLNVDEIDTQSLFKAQQAAVAALKQIEK